MSHTYTLKSLVVRAIFIPRKCYSPTILKRIVWHNKITVYERILVFGAFVLFSVLIANKHTPKMKNPGYGFRIGILHWNRKKKTKKISQGRKLRQFSLVCACELFPHQKSSWKCAVLEWNPSYFMPRHKLIVDLLENTLWWCGKYVNSAWVCVCVRVWVSSIRSNGCVVCSERVRKWIPILLWMPWNCSCFSAKQPSCHHRLKTGKTNRGISSAINFPCQIHPLAHIIASSSGPKTQGHRIGQ